MVASSRAWLRTAATSFRSALTAASLTLLLGLGALSVLTAPQPPAERIGLSNEDERLSRVMERNNCSTTGFESDVTPRTAVIETRRGRTLLVSFERGWAVFNKEEPGRLLAVCLGTARQLQRPQVTQIHG